MKKTVKRAATLVIVLIMLCTMTVIAYAATYTGSFTAIVGTGKYTGNYTETLNVSTERASASLSITNYNGYYDSLYAASIDLSVWVMVDGDYQPFGSNNAYGGLSCSISIPYGSTYEGAFATCDYAFMGTNLPSQMLYAD